MNEDDKLERWLREDLPDEPEAHPALAQVFRRWRTPQPTPADTAQLIERLLPEMPRLSRWRAMREWWPLLLIHAQVRILRREIWAATALVMMLGVVVTLGTYTGEGLTPLAVLAPVVAAVGVALLYDGDLALVFELEDSTPVSMRLLLLARLTLIFSFNLSLGLVGSIMLSLLNADMLLWPLVLSWLVPMAFLSALAFWLSVVSGDSVAGAAFSLLIWGLHVVLRASPASNPIVYVLSLPGLGDATMRPVVIGAALLLLAVAFWLIERKERRISDAA